MKYWITFCLISVIVNINAQTIQGWVQEKEHERPIPFAQIWIPEIGRGAQADEDGMFWVQKVPQGGLHLQVTRVGFAPLTQKILVETTDTLKVVLKMTLSHTALQEVVVQGEMQTPSQTVVLSGTDLRRNLGTTIAETLADEAGMAMRSMGPAPARPVLRGLSGDRLLILEAGNKTGDLSATSADHALAIESINAQNLLVVRGAEALKYGAANIGGVIDVNRAFVPEHLPENRHLEFSTQVESANLGTVLGLNIGNALLKNWAYHSDFSWRRAANLKAPQQRLQNTDLQTINASFGLSKVMNEGFMGGAFNHYQTQYGIPGGFIGGHPNGVDIRMYRNLATLKAHVIPKHHRLKQLDFSSVLTYLFQQEFESADFVGVEFALATLNSKIETQWQSKYLDDVGFGLQHEYRNLAIGGLNFSPNSTENSIGVYGLGKKHWGRWDATAVMRADFRNIQPTPENPLSRIGPIVKRQFGGLSGGLSLHFQPVSAYQSAIHLLRTLRMPTVEELFSEGPHLAAYSFDVGNPQLQAEKGFGLEWANHLKGEAGEVKIALFRNDFSGYIFLEDTGRINYRTLLPIYQYKGESAKMMGAEASVEGHLGRWVGNLSGSYVEGRIKSGGYLPQIPPLHGKIELQYVAPKWQVYSKLRWAKAQNQLSVFEASTAGYQVIDAGLQWQHFAKKRLHTLDFGVENLLNTTYRDHLSRIKSIMPESGINVKVLYKLYW